MTIAKLALDQAGRVVVIDDQTGTLSGAPHIAAQAYDSTYQALWVDTGAVNATADHYNNGLRFTTVGALRIYDATAGLPATTNTHLGMAMTTDGQVCVTSGASTAPYVLNGVAMTNDGRVYVDILSFALEFADLGAGVVSTVEAIGGATPTFTRATTATTVLSTGLIGAVASGDPRSYYDPTSLTYLGYLAEGARTNLGLSSEDLRSAAAGNPVTEWTNTDTTVTVAGTTAPDGANTGNLITEGSAGTAVVLNSFTGTADVSYATARFMKIGNTNWVFMDISETAAVANGIRVWFNLSTGVVGTVTNAGTATGGAGRIKAYPNGWYRCEVSGTVGNAATGISTRSFSASADNSTTRVANATRYEWGAQIENNVSFASSYIPTTTLAVARNADVLTYPTTGWYSDTQGTAFAEFQANWTTTAASQFVLARDGNGRFFYNAGTAATSVSNFDGTTAGASNTTSTYGFSTARAATAYSDSTKITSLSGGIGSTSAFDGGMGLGDLAVGCGNNGGNVWFGPIRRVEYYANRMPNAVLQALTNGAR